MAKKPTPKKETVRQRTEKSASQKPKKRRIRKAASTASQPVKKVWHGATREYHVIPQKEKGFLGFMTKSRRFIPRYFRDSWQELKKVTWPNRRTSWNLVFAVYIFAIVFGLTIALVDYGLEKLFKQILL